jgi:NitT/TauT family transport system substrate-binding protein
MTSKEGGLAGKLQLASDVLYATKAIPEKIPLSAIQDAIDPTYLRAYMKSVGK